MTDRWGLGKHVYYPNMHPIETDIGLPAPTQMVERVGQQHLLVQTISTGAVEMAKLDGSDKRAGIILELEGRFNRTEVPGHHMAVLNVEAAMILYDNLAHSLKALMDAGLLEKYQ